MTLGQMPKNIFTSVLIIAIIISLAACSSSEIVTGKDFKQIKEKDTPNKIQVTTKDSAVYHFVKPDFYVENDTLYGMKKFILNDNERWLVRKIALSDIEYIQTEMGAWKYTLVLVGLTLALFVSVFIIII
jgi:hypothetical protein